MRVEQHYDEEILISFVGAHDEAASDRHLASCSSCSETLEQFRLLAGSLSDESVWDPQEFDSAPNANTIATLRAFADDLSRDDAVAVPLVASLLATSRETWAAQLAEHPEWRTPGTVRALVAATQRLIDTMPPDAAAAAALAVDIAEHLDPRRHGFEVVAKLRGAAWRERAYALGFIGEFQQAIAAIDKSDAAFQVCLVDEYDLGRTAIVRGLLYRSVDRLSDALPYVRTAANVFARSGDNGRRCSALMMEGIAAVTLGDHRRGIVLFDEVKTLAPDADTQARALANLGNCHRALREPEDALRCYEVAAHLYDELGATIEAARIRWNRAVVLADCGRHVEALERLLTVKNEFKQVGMAYDAALIGLSAAESLLALDRPSEVASLAREAIALFETLGVAYTGKALTALAYLREAAELGRLTPALVTTVRTYVHELPSKPHLLFAYPPQ